MEVNRTWNHLVNNIFKMSSFVSHRRKKAIHVCNDMTGSKCWQNFLFFSFLYTRSFLSHCGISMVNDCLLKWKRASGYHWWEIVAFHSCRLILNIKRSGIKWETKIKSGGKRKNKVSRCWDLVLNVQRVLGATDFSHLICGVVSSEYQSASSVSSTRSFIYQVQQ